MCGAFGRAKPFLWCRRGLSPDDPIGPQKLGPLRWEVEVELVERRLSEAGARRTQVDRPWHVLQLSPEVLDCGQATRVPLWGGGVKGVPLQHGREGGGATN